jgi:hypothetical protein
MFKVGDKVRVKADGRLTSPLFHNQEGEVVEIHSGCVKVKLLSFKHPLLAGDENTWNFGDAFDRLEIIGQSNVSASTLGATVPTRQEKPCQVCSRPNDVGVNVCWSCGNQPF